MCNISAFIESNFLGLKFKSGDRLLPRLNIDGNPIANKYCEGKTKRTLKKGLKDLKPLRRKVWNPANPAKRRWSRSALGTYGRRHPQSVVHSSERQDEVRTLNSSAKEDDA